MGTSQTNHVFEDFKIDSPLFLSAECIGHSESIFDLSAINIPESKLVDFILTRLGWWHRSQEVRPDLCPVIKRQVLERDVDVDTGLDCLV
jgi:hypothetical protein